MARLFVRDPEAFVFNFGALPEAAKQLEQRIKAPCFEQA